MARLPNLIIAGVHLSGTSSLFTHLGLHPDIGSSSVKETLYFLPLRDGGSLSPIREYTKFFSGCDSQRYLIEASPGYFHGGQAIARAIKRVCGDVRIVIILREPIDRLLSNYKYLKSKIILSQDTSFEEYVQNSKTPPRYRYGATVNSYWAIRVGFYADFLPEWFDVFGDSIKVLFFDDLKNDSPRVLRDLCKWLDISDECLDSVKMSVMHQSINYRFELLHSLALRFNMKTIPFWNKRPLWKNRMIGLYNKLNGIRFSNERSGMVINELESLYEPYNRCLAGQLRARGYVNLPSWLATL